MFKSRHEMKGSARAVAIHGMVVVSLALLLAGNANAQDSRLWEANSSNNRINLVTFDPPQTTVQNDDANTRKSLRGMTVRHDGVDGTHLIVCDYTAGETLFYQDARGTGQVITGPSMTNSPALPEGPSVAPDGSLFLVSAGTGAATEKDAEVWVVVRDGTCPAGSPPHPNLSGGYLDPPGLLDGEFVVSGTPQSVELLSDTLVVTGNAGRVAAGDLLVVASDPAMVLLYPAAAIDGFVTALCARLPGDPAPAGISPEILIHPPSAAVAEINKFPGGAAPGGIAVAPDGNFLIPSEGGVVFRYDANGERLADFATNLGPGKFQIAVGAQRGNFRAFLADRNGGEVLRFTIRPDGTGILDGSVQNGVEHPIGIETTTGNDVAAPAGSNVTVSPTDVIESTFEVVTAAGVFSARVFLFTDPRESEPGAPADPAAPLHRSLDLSTLTSELPSILVPEHVRFFGKNDPENGPPTIIVTQMDNSAAFDGIIEHLGLEASILGYEPDCNDPDHFMQSRIFWSPEPAEPSIVEGPIEIDITTECGSHRGWSRDTSIFLVSARDTRELDVIADTKLTNLDLTLNAPAGSCIKKKTKQQLQRDLDAARRNFDRGRTSKAASSLEDFIARIENNPSAFNGCTDVNISGELRSRAQSNLFFMNRLP